MTMEGAGTREEGAGQPGRHVHLITHYHHGNYLPSTDQEEAGLLEGVEPLEE